jgi:hypothetical protein
VVYLAKLIHNKLVVTGHPSKLSEFVRTARRFGSNGETISELSLNNYARMPDVLLREPPRDDDDLDGEMCSRYGFDNWRDWRIHHWGISHDLVVPVAISSASRKMVYEFDSEWNPPMEGIRHMSRIHGRLVFLITYTDLFLGTTGKNRYSRGHCNIHFYERMDEVRCPQCETEVYRNADGECVFCRYNFEDNQEEE